ncbi:MAG: DNA cytosine methyltransferase [Chloroflexota bacterium]|nr:DNA cytosine methyltransferase [Chloroflexota bacterium]
MTAANHAATTHAVDLFCGIGGLTHGLAQSGIEVKAGFDSDESCRFAYETNNPGSEFKANDVRTLGRDDIMPYFAGAKATALVGCMPCQPFSAHNRKWRKDADCSLVYEFARLVAETLPDVVSMENVPGLARHDAFSDFLETLEGLNYTHDVDVVMCSDYGVPQRRKRLVLLASRIGSILIPRLGSHEATVREFIEGLPPINDGEAHPDDPAHKSLPLTDINRRRIRQSKPGGTWKDWDEELLSACHENSYYPAPYGRMQWDDLAPTITTQSCYYSTGRFGHPEQDRAISVREAALLQTFPADYEFCPKEEPVFVRDAARQIGNAVPVRLARAIGDSILEVTGDR